MDKKRLIIELLNGFKQAKDKAKRTKLNIDKSNKQVFVQSETGINPRYISDEHYFQIVEFYNFLQENPDLTTNEIREVLKGKTLKFAFLRKLDQLIPDLFDELKQHGPGSIATHYVNFIYFKNPNKQLRDLEDDVNSY